MIAVDTNIIVRLLTQDDDAQFQKAYQLFSENDVLVADSVILETGWVLRFAYQFDSRQIIDVLTQLFGLPNVHLSQPALLAQALAWHSQGLEFADAFHLAHCQQCKKFYTFDSKMVNAAKLIDGCQVVLL